MIANQVSSVFYFIARAVQFGDLLPVEEDLDNYNNIFSMPRGLNNNNNILPRSDQKHFQYFTEHEYGGAKAGGIKNILIENSAPKRWLKIYKLTNSILGT